MTDWSQLVFDEECDMDSRLFYIIGEPAQPWQNHIRGFIL